MAYERDMTLRISFGSTLADRKAMSVFMLKVIRTNTQCPDEIDAGEGIGCADRVWPR